MSPRPPVATLAVLTCLYLAQGLPSGLLAHALPAMLRSWEVPLEWIGALKLLALPWFLKVLWAPWVDRRGQRTRWILCCQTAAIVLLLAVGCLPVDQLRETGWLLLLAGLLFLMNTASASQDIGTDGWAVQRLPRAWLGAGNSVQVAAYKLGLILGGSLLLMLVDSLGWRGSFWGMAALLALLSLPLLFTRDGRNTVDAAPAVSQYREAWQGFLQHPGIGPLLALLLLYKLGDAFGSGMIRPMLVDHGLTLAEVGQVTLLASLAGLLAAVLAGGLCFRLGLLRVLWWGGALQALGLFGWALVPLLAPGWSVILGVAVFEQIGDAISTVALFAWMMAHCRQAWAGTDYTLQSCILVTLGGAAGLLSGFVAASSGYVWFFLLAGLLGLLGLLPLRRVVQPS